MSLNGRRRMRRSRRIKRRRRRRRIISAFQKRDARFRMRSLQFYGEITIYIHWNNDCNSIGLIMQREQTWSHIQRCKQKHLIASRALAVCSWLHLWCLGNRAGNYHWRVTWWNIDALYFEHGNHLQVWIQLQQMIRVSSPTNSIRGESNDRTIMKQRHHQKAKKAILGF